MRKKFVSVLLVLCLLLSSISLSAFADEIDVGWTNVKREEFMERVYAGNVTVTEFRETLGQDDDLDRLMIGCLSEIFANPVTVGYEESFDEPVGSESWLSVTVDDGPSSNLMHRSTCKLYGWTSDNLMRNRFSASGVLVGNDYLLTAGHCVYTNHDFCDIDHDADDQISEKECSNLHWAKDTYVNTILLVPDVYFLDNGTEQWWQGYAFCDIESSVLGSNWKGKNFRSDDWALLRVVDKDSKFPCDIGVTRFRNIRYVDDGDLVTAYGYPGLSYDGSPYDLSNLVSCESALSRKTEIISLFETDTYCCTQFYGRQGMSGGPVFDNFGNLVGVWSASGLNDSETSKICGIFADLDDEMACALSVCFE